MTVLEQQQNKINLNESGWVKLASKSPGRLQDKENMNSVNVLVKDAKLLELQSAELKKAQIVLSTDPQFQGPQISPIGHTYYNSYEERLSADFKSIYISNLDYSITKEYLTEIFTTVGPISRATIQIDKITSKSKGFAYIQFMSEESVQKAIDAWDGKKLCNRPIKVAMKRTNNPQINMQAGVSNPNLSLMAGQNQGTHASHHQNLGMNQQTYNPHLSNFGIAGMCASALGDQRAMLLNSCSGQSLNQAYPHHNGLLQSQISPNPIPIPVSHTSQSSQDLSTGLNPSTISEPSPGQNNENIFQASIFNQNNNLPHATFGGNANFNYQNNLFFNQYSPNNNCNGNIWSGQMINQVSPQNNENINQNF